MVAIMRENSGTMRSVAEENTIGLMESITRVNGNVTRCMDMVYFLGRMVNAMRVNSSMISEKAREHLLGLMEGSTSESGEAASSMAVALISPKTI
jgi:hypothetical protein